MYKAIVYGTLDPKIWDIARLIHAGIQGMGNRALLRNQSPFLSDSEYEPADFATCWGMHAQGKQIVSSFNRRGKPVIVVDAGYYGRKDCYLQFSINGLNNLPDGPLPDDRARAQGLIAAPVRQRKGYGLVLAQKPGDAQHGIDDMPAMIAMLCDAARLDGLEPRVRPHPQVAPADCTLAEDLAGAAAVFTWNSTAAYEAMIAGVPVRVFGPAVYREAVETGELQPLLNRVAYGQWQPTEIISGQAFRFILPRLGFRVSDPFEDTPEPETYTEPTATPTAYDCTVQELRLMCRTRGLDARGNRETLIARLRDNDYVVD